MRGLPLRGDGRHGPLIGMLVTLFSGAIAFVVAALLFHLREPRREVPGRKLSGSIAEGHA